MKADNRYRGFLSSIQTLRSIFFTLPIIFKIIVLACVSVGTITLSIYLWQKNIDLMVEIPAPYGSFTEGVVGNPRFINPILAVSDVDKDLTTLIYSGLMRKKSDGSLIEDLAQSHTISEDFKTYHFILKPDLTWHDGTPITTKDIAYTINSTKNPDLKSPFQSLWNNVTVEIKNDREITFSLNKPFPGFLEMLSLGILPAHIWSNIDINNFAFSEYNLDPIGSGPYKIDKIKKDSAGVPTLFELKSFKNFALGKPHINQINLHLYPNETLLIADYEQGKIDSMNSVNPSYVEKIKSADKRIITTPLPRVFGLFFNQNQNPIFTQAEVREALDLLIDKNYIVENVLNGYGTVVNGPLSPQTFGYEAIKSTDIEADQRSQTSLDILTKNGWAPNKDGILMKKINGSDTLLKLTITTTDSEELKTIASFVKTQWEKIGIQVDIIVLDQNTLNQEAIRPRKYDVLLFGMVIGNEADLYSFWHSSQRSDPGLNISFYTSVQTDNLLAKLESTNDKEQRRDLVRQIQNTIASDHPAVFMYSPYFIYAAPKEVQNIEIKYLTRSSDRLLQIYDWYIDTEYIWKIFK